MNGGWADTRVAGTWPPLTMFLGWAEEPMAMKEKPKGVPKACWPRSRTWCGHAGAGGAPAQRYALAAPLLPLQRAVPAWPARANAVLLPGAGLSFHPVWRSSKAAQGHSRLRWPCPPPCHSALSARSPPTESSDLHQAAGPASRQHGAKRTLGTESHSHMVA